MKRQKKTARNTQQKQPGLMSLAGQKRVLLTISGIIAIVGTLLSFAPYLGIYAIVREILMHIDDLSKASVPMLMQIAVVVLIATTAGLLCSFVANLISHKAAFHVVHDLRMRFARHIAKLPMGFHTANSTAKIRKTMNENIGKVETFIAHQLPDTIGAFAAPITAIVLLFVFDWRLGLACFVGLLVAFAVEMYGMSQPASRKFAELYQQKQLEMANSSVEYIRGIPVVKAFGQTIYSFKRFYETIKENETMSLDYANSVKRSYTLFQVILNSLFLFVLPVGVLIGSRTANYQAFALTFLFYLFFAGALSGPVMKLLYVFTSFHAMKFSVSQINDIFAMPIIADEGKVTNITDHTIAFEEVSFSYMDDEASNALEHVSFTAKAGRLTALVGPSGSGKTTIAQLIPRFWDVQTGKITIGGVDVRDIANETLMSNLSFVFQDVFLFQKSIRDNIKVGRESATDAEVIQAAKAAMCHDFIEALPNGYDTLFGKKGTYFSGGEMQRIVIARAILKNAPIVILDEATAFADPENEQKIQEGLEQLMEGKTVIIIAHRLSTIRSADHIVVTDCGHVVEQGTHDELIQNGNKYKEMWASYSAALAWKLKEGVQTA
ncbi:MAG: ABC transporter ATP-binding protein [Lachnospiraceae bacterium]